MTRPFSKAVLRIPEIANSFETGLQALRKSDRAAITANDPRTLVGSVDIDSALKSKYPHDNRWDYCIGITVGKTTDSVVWVEVHPANSHSVTDMVAKASWLFSWLKGPGKPLRDLAKDKPDLRWVPTGPVAFRRGGKQHVQLANAGISFPERRVVL